MDDINWSKSHEDIANGLINDEFIFQLPFAGTNFSVQLLFNIFEPWQPPDLIFKDLRFTNYVVQKTDLDKYVSYI